jgi:hypothetical protein
MASTAASFDHSLEMNTFEAGYQEPPYGGSEPQIDRQEGDTDLSGPAELQDGPDYGTDLGIFLTRTILRDLDDQAETAGEPGLATAFPDAAGRETDFRKEMAGRLKAEYNIDQPDRYPVPILADMLDSSRVPNP